MKRVFPSIGVLIWCALAGASSTGIPESSTIRIKDLYLARHGQTEWNRLSRFQGDPDLDPKGYEDRVALFLLMRDTRIEAIFTSAKQRTRQTAAVLADCLNITPVADPDINEIGKGIFEGVCGQGYRDDLGRSEANSCRPEGPLDPGSPVARYLREEYAKMMADRLRYRPPGGESIADTEGRVDRFLENHKDAIETKTILIVGHRGINAVILTRLLGWPLENTEGFEQHNDWVFHIQSDASGKPVLSLFRDGAWRPCAGRPDPKLGLDCTR